MQRIMIRDLLQQEPDGSPQHVAGWVRSRRDSKGGFSFIEVSDGSSIRTLQVVADARLPNYDSDILRLNTGASLSVEGLYVQSQGKGQSGELQATSIVAHGFVEEDYPLQKKRHSFEFLREISHLRPRTNTLGAIARLRSTLSFAVHRFFHERSFVQVHTPIISGLDAEGAGQLFRVTTLESGGSKSSDKAPYEKDFFGKPTFLTVSGQLQAEAYALALSNVYVFGPTFRAENSNTSRHLAEFWMVEPEVAFCDLDQDAALAEEFLKYVLKAALNECSDDMAFFAQFVDKQAVSRIEHIISKEFERMTYTKAVELLQASGKAFEFPVEWGRDLQSEHERWLTETHVGRPVIVTDYPKDIKAFYMKQNEDGRTVRAMDVLVPRIGEIIGGSQREDRLEVLKSAMAERGMHGQELEWYTDLRRFGGVPHSGFGMGFERLIQYVSGMENIRDVIPFPRTPKHALL